VLQFLDGYPFIAARVQYIDDVGQDDAQVEGRAAPLRERATEIIQMLPQVPAELVASFEAIEAPGALADFIAGLIDVSAEEKQSLLETFDLKARLDKLLDLLTHRIEVLKVSKEVDERTRESIGDANRKHLLREQLRTIQKELGDEEDDTAELAELEKALADAGMPEDVEKHARKELKRLQRMQGGGPESGMIRSYPRLARGAAVEGRAAPGDRPRRRAPRARRGPLRPGQDQASHPRVPRGEEAESHRARARSCASSALPAWARPRSASRSRRRRGASSSA
jgi:ATP-dependent Lon protease